MKTVRLIQMTTLAFALGISVTTAEAQGRGKGQGAEKPNPGQSEKPTPGQARGQGKQETAPVASPAPRGAMQKTVAGNNAGQARAAENRSAMASSRGRPAEHIPSEHIPGNASRAPGNASHVLPASPNASPRASVAAAPNRGRAESRYARDLRVSEVRPVVRNYVISNRPSQFVTGGAVAYGLARGAQENALLVTPTGRDVAIRNRRGDVLLALDDDAARTLGAWQVSPIDERVTSGAPSFCRSGAGHPVWGRQWCLDKGFGLGTEQNVQWGITPDVGDIIFGGGVISPTLTRDALLSLLGPVAFDRLALHAVTLGYTDPLTGVWRSEASGPDVLLVNSGIYPIAEIVDANRDQRPDLMLVALRPW